MNYTRNVSLAIAWILFLACSNNNKEYEEFQRDIRTIDPEVICSLSNDYKFKNQNFDSKEFELFFNGKIDSLYPEFKFKYEFAMKGVSPFVPYQDWVFIISTRKDLNDSTKDLPLIELNKSNFKKHHFLVNHFCENLSKLSSE